MPSTGGRVNRLDLSSGCLNVLMLPLGCQAGAFVCHPVADVAAAAGVADGAVAAADGADLVAHMRHPSLQRLARHGQVRPGVVQYQLQQLLGSCYACCDPGAAGCTCHRCCPAAAHNLA